MEPIKLTIHDVSRGGSGVGKLESGEIVFVPFTAPGDELLVRILKKTKSYSQGELVEILKPSPVREKPLCKIFEKCGGCSWQHLPYSLQFETKKKGVLHALKRTGVAVDLAAVNLDEFPAANPYHYRNRIQLRGDPKTGDIGFFEKGSTQMVPLDRCEIAHENINAALAGVKKKGSSLDREFKVEIDMDADGVVQTAWNQRHAALGFRQVNDEQNQVLQNWVSNHIENGTYLIDLFGGSGNLSLPLIERFQEVHCVDAFVPVEKDGLPSNFHFHKTQVLKWLDMSRRKKWNGSASVILDPPREGLGHDFDTIESMLRSTFAPKQVLYIGCDVDSFAKDVHRFIQKGYQLKRLGVLDFFPQTPHVESLAILTI